MAKARKYEKRSIGEKRGIVKQISEGVERGERVTDLARDHGISPGQYHTWVKILRTKGGAKYSPMKQPDQAKPASTVRPWAKRSGGVLVVYGTEQQVVTVMRDLL